MFPLVTYLCFSSVGAGEPMADAVCENLNYHFEDGNLTISGTGQITENCVTGLGYRGLTEHLIVEQSVNRIGERAFRQ
jgi:hypothetical protein